MKTNNLINLFRLYWIENKKMLFLFSLVVFLFYLLLTGIVYYSAQYYKVRIRYELAMLGMFFLLFQIKTIMVTSTNYNYMILSAKTVDKWILSLFIYVFVTFLICFSSTVLGQVLGGYLAYWLGHDGNIALEIIYNQQDLLQNFCFFFLVQGVILFLFLTKSLLRPFSQMTVNNKIILLILFLSFALSIKFMPFLVDNQDITGWIALVVGGLFWIMNYFVIKNKELK